mgnify:CR=1 FL=1
MAAAAVAVEVVQMQYENMKDKVLMVWMIWFLLAVGVVSAYPVHTHWNFNQNYVDVEAYHCNDNTCTSVTGPFFTGNTGSAYSMDIDYDVDAVCNTPHYTAFYFYKECYLPMEWSVWTQCEYTYSANVNFIKKSDCKAEISSVDTPLSVQTGEQVEIVANIKSVLIDPGTTPIYVPPHRKEYYSSNVIVTLTVEKNGVNVHTESKTVSIYMSTTEAVRFYWIPTEGGTYTIHITTNVDDCKCSSSLEDSVERTLEVTGPEQHYPVIDEMQILPLHPDENDDIYVMDSNNGRIAIFNPQGELKASIGTIGGYPGAFYTPKGIYLHDGKIYAANTRNHIVYVFDKVSRKLIASYGLLGEDPANLKKGSLEYRFRLPTDVAVTPDGIIYVVDSKHGIIKVLDSEGKYLFKFGGIGKGLGEFNFPEGIALDSQQNVYVLSLIHI